MATAPTWMTRVIMDAENVDSPEDIARAIFMSPQIINGIRSAIAAWYEGEEQRKKLEAENGGRMIYGAPTKAEAIRGAVIQAVESYEL